MIAHDLVHNLINVMVCRNLTMETKQSGSYSWWPREHSKQDLDGQSAESVCNTPIEANQSFCDLLSFFCGACTGEFRVLSILGSTPAYLRMTIAGSNVGFSCGEGIKRRDPSLSSGTLPLRGIVNQSLVSGSVVNCRGAMAQWRRGTKGVVGVRCIIFQQ